MWHILGPKHDVSIATLVRVLLAMAMEIWDRECGLFRPIFVVFSILRQVGNTISPLGKGSSQKVAAFLVAYEQGSSSLEIRICSSDLAGVMQSTVLATLPNVAFLAVFFPDERPSPRGTAGSQRDGKPNPDARDER